MTPLGTDSSKFECSRGTIGPKLTLLFFAEMSSFWAYELGKRCLGYQDGKSNANIKILLAGGLAGVVTWTSVFPLDVIKTRLQSPEAFAIERRPGLASNPLLEATAGRTAGTFAVARQIYEREGFSGFFRGLGVCSIRAFIVNAVQVSPPPSTRKVSVLKTQWACYEWSMKALT